ncbi:Beta-glucosidase 40 [Zea mays]|uniref:Beta-glucosidase 40 n=1 Tax=Zea mays TaxID=4577 RepID=A0A1D6JSU0_MAIZE|nr:Beta-glucosidase 40 [Zea mays]
MGRRIMKSGRRTTMQPRPALLLLVLVLGVSLRGCIAQGGGGGGGLTRGSFPKGFVFGTAAAAYQYEGAVKTDGRGQTIWDTFAHTFGKISDFSNADVAVDQYHRFEEDVQLMADMGMDAYRFSIAWSRILPNGTGQVNQAGIDHYNKVINALLSKGIQPYVTLYHWDLPQALEDRYNGWLDRQIVNDFAAYAETCFKAFGDRVKHWITLNEPHTVAVQGYDAGLHAPGRCSVLLHLYCRTGNSGTEPYIVAHNFILAHATVSDMYRRKYKAAQNGELGIAFDVIWYEPMTNSTIDIEATKRAQEFQLGWFADPFFFGDYPATMRARVGERLPKFTADEAALVKGALDFMGINHYTTFYTRHNDTNIIGRLLNDTLADTGTISLPFDKNGKPIGDRFDFLPSLAAYMPDIWERDAVRREDGCDVRGYFAWSLLDNWEWAAGYTSRFGLYFVDYKDNLKRHPKNSVQWFKTLLSSS